MRDDARSCRRLIAKRASAFLCFCNHRRRRCWMFALRRPSLSFSLPRFFRQMLWPPPRARGEGERESGTCLGIEAMTITSKWSSRSLHHACSCVHLKSFQAAKNQVPFPPSFRANLIQVVKNLSMNLRIPFLSAPKATGKHLWKLSQDHYQDLVSLSDLPTSPQANSSGD